MGFLPKQKLHNYKKLVTFLSFEAKHLANVLLVSLKTITSNTLGNSNNTLEKKNILNYGKSLTHFSVCLDFHYKSSCPRTDNFHTVILWGKKKKVIASGKNQKNSNILNSSTLHCDV